MRMSYFKEGPFIYLTLGWNKIHGLETYERPRDLLSRCPTNKQNCLLKSELMWEFEHPISCTTDAQNIDKVTQWYLDLKLRCKGCAPLLVWAALTLSICTERPV